jgi:hypothetical protein
MGPGGATFEPEPKAGAEEKEHHQKENQGDRHTRHTDCLSEMMLNKFTTVPREGALQRVGQQVTADRRRASRDRWSLAHLNCFEFLRH